MPVTLGQGPALPGGRGIVAVGLQSLSWVSVLVSAPLADPRANGCCLVTLPDAPWLRKGGRGGGWAGTHLRAVGWGAQPDCVCTPRRGGAWSSPSTCGQWAMSSGVNTLTPRTRPTGSPTRRTGPK